MQNLKRPMIRLLAVILSAVLGSLLILGEPASAMTSGESILVPCFKSTCPLEPNTGYKIKRIEKGSNNSCDGETIYAKFSFEGEQFPGGNFEETYPIQDNWELHFNTPLSDEKTGTLNVTSENNCGFVLEKQPLELLSGFKPKDEACENTSGHFVVAKDYYAARRKYGLEACYGKVIGDYCYEPLGSLTGITGDNFPALGGAVVGQIIIKPNAIRAPHWHLQFAEAGYCYEGIGQVGVIVPSKTIPKSANSQEFYPEKIVEEMFIQKDELFLFPEASQHYLRNIGNDDFKCTLFFTEGPPLNGDQLLTITLQNVVGNTPLGVLGPVFVTDEDNDSKPYTSENISLSPAQAFSSADQGPDVIEVVEACRGQDPDISSPGCNSSTVQKCPISDKFGFSVFSTMEP